MPGALSLSFNQVQTLTCATLPGHSFHIVASTTAAKCGLEDSLIRYWADGKAMHTWHTSKSTVNSIAPALYCATKLPAYNFPLSFFRLTAPEVEGKW